MSTPARLHFVWVGDDSKRPDGCIDSWRRLNPDYEVRVWGNGDLASRKWVNAEHMRQMSRYELCGVADLMRYELLYEFGGIALDADSMCVRPLESWLLEPDDFTCWSNELHLPGLLANGFMGAAPHSAYIAAIIMRINDKSSVVSDRAWKTTGPTVTTNVWREFSYPLTIYPSHYFLPDFHPGASYAGVGLVFARQFYGSTYNGLRAGSQDEYDRIGRLVLEDVTDAVLPLDGSSPSGGRAHEVAGRAD